MAACGELLLSQSGQLALPGEPVADGSSGRGLFIHESRTSEQSRKLFTTHSAISLAWQRIAGLLRFQRILWVCASARRGAAGVTEA
jgi:hypothetical protein